MVGANERSMDTCSVMVKGIWDRANSVIDVLRNKMIVTKKIMSGWLLNEHWIDQEVGRLNHGDTVWSRSAGSYLGNLANCRNNLRSEKLSAGSASGTQSWIGLSLESMS